jgi:hypothetical protein
MRQPAIEKVFDSEVNSTVQSIAPGTCSTYLDYGAFTPIQVAATAALNGPDDCIKEMRATYKKRRDALVESLRHGDIRLFQKQLGEFQAAELPEFFRDRHPGEHRGFGRRQLPLCPHRARRERAAHPASGPQRPPLLRQRRPHALQDTDAR